MDLNQLKVLSDFLNDTAREDVKIVALQELLGLTGSRESCSLIENTEIPRSLIKCLLNDNKVICKSACLSLVNISATERGADQLINAYSSSDEQEIIKSLLCHILDPNSNTADAACMTLSNLTRQSKTALLVVDCMAEAKIEIDSLINAFTIINFNTKGCTLHYLGPIFSNLSQTSEFRRQLMNKTKCLIQKLLPFTQFQMSAIRRAGIVGTLRNCCFDTGYHEWLLGNGVDILPYLLLPLAGPEELSEEDNSKLPLDLQYLEEDKEREPDTDIRKMLLEAIHQLCATKHGREFLRSKNTYVILREYHKWEKDRSVLLACENVVDILIRTEEEIDVDNLKELDVPDSYVSKFEEMDEQYIREKNGSYLLLKKWKEGQFRVIFSNFPLPKVIADDFTEEGGQL